jgi:hypothetical protein
MEYYVVALVAVAGVNWIAGRYGSRSTQRFTFALSAGAPIILWAGFNSWLLMKDGAAAFRDPYFVVLLTIIAGMTVLTTIAAFLGKQLAATGK